MNLKKAHQTEGRRDKVMQLSRQGYSDLKIARMIGFPRAVVQNDIKTRLEAHIKLHDDTAKIRAMTINRLEALLQVWSVEAQHDKVALKCTLQIIDKIARYAGVAPAQTMEVRHSGLVESKSKNTVRIEFVEAEKKTIIEGDSVEVVEREPLSADVVNDEVPVESS